MKVESDWEYKTDKNGEINVKDLAYGKYSFVEKTSPMVTFLLKNQLCSK